MLGTLSGVTWNHHFFLDFYSLILTHGVLELTAIGRASSGVYFSPLVGGDINGDGRLNDRAFVFDPAVEAARGDTAVANGMTRLLANTSGRARDCLLSEMGKVLIGTGNNSR